MFFSELFGANLTHSLFKVYWSWFEAFPYLHIGDTGRSFVKAE